MRCKDALEKYQVISNNANLRTMWKKKSDLSIFHIISIFYGAIDRIEVE